MHLAKSPWRQGKLEKKVISDCTPVRTQESFILNIEDVRVPSPNAPPDSIRHARQSHTNTNRSELATMLDCDYEEQRGEKRFKDKQNHKSREHSRECLHTFVKRKLNGRCATVD